MKIRELKALATLAEELHFGRAAERLGIAQPQLSEMIRRIESEARVTIFERRPHVRVTHGGAVLVETARRVLAELDAGTQRARAVAAGRIGRVSLGFSPVAMCSDLPD
ncbi:MAG TPA: LysR family transcriptional regulator, partial [Allosphingosinicella sp.]